MRGAHGLKKLGIEKLRPIITRGVLIDIAGYKEVETLPGSYEVTVEDVRGALGKQGMSEVDLRPGDALFFRYVWARLWTQPGSYNHNPPGIGLEVARWVAARQASMVGSDQWTTEVVPNLDSELVFPVHQELLVKNGIFNLENMVLDELAAPAACCSPSSPMPAQRDRCSSWDPLQPHRRRGHCGSPSTASCCGSPLGWSSATCGVGEAGPGH